MTSLRRLSNPVTCGPTFLQFPSQNSTIYSYFRFIVQLARDRFPARIAVVLERNPAVEMLVLMLNSQNASEQAVSMTVKALEAELSEQRAEMKR